MPGMRYLAGILNLVNEQQNSFLENDVKMSVFYEIINSLTHLKCKTIILPFYMHINQKNTHYLLSKYTFKDHGKYMKVHKSLGLIGLNQGQIFYYFHLPNFLLPHERGHTRLTQQKRVFRTNFIQGNYYSMKKTNSII